MLDSSRPHPHMPALSKLLPARAGHPWSPRKIALAAAALLVCPFAGPFAHASVHHAVAPVRRAALPPLHTRARQAAHGAAQTKPGRSTRAHATAAQETNHGSRTSHAAAHVRAESPLGRKNNRVVELHGAAAHGAAGHNRRGTRAAALDREETADTSPRLRSGHAEQSSARPDDALADSGTRDRVHAWYKTHTASATLASAHPPASRPARTPDLATTAPKATAADFDRAAAAQRSTIRSAAEQNSRQTTAADDAADAESHIPSTAPTAREPAPFVHGDDESTPAASGFSSRTPAPVVRQPVRQPARQTIRPVVPSAAREPNPTASTEALNLSPPAALSTVPSARNAHPDLAPVVRGKGVAPASVSDARALAPIPVATAGDSSARAVQAIALETAASPTPRLQLPSPPVAGRKPAIAAVQAGARHIVLDPAVSNGMADETFDGDDTPATAATAIQLATSPATPRSKPVDDLSPTASVVPVNLFDGQGHLALLPPMRGSHEILVHQNRMAVSDGLERIANDRELADMHRLKLLVDLPDDDSIYPNDALPLNRRYARPWTVRFLRDMARAHYTRFGTPLIVTSAVRTVEFQRRLVRVNGNAAPPTGDIASPHLYGQAIDLAKRGMSLTEITWMRAYLGPVEDQGKIDVEEEFQQACFHISVYRRYLGAPPARQKPAPPALLETKATPVPPPAEKHRHLPTALLATQLP